MKKKKPNHYYYVGAFQMKINGWCLKENRKTDNDAICLVLPGMPQNRFFINRKNLFPTFFIEYSHIRDLTLSVSVFRNVDRIYLRKRTNERKRERKRERERLEVLTIKDKLLRIH